MARCSSERGFVLIATCIALAILLGLAALGIDIGRMYVIKSELQAFSDAAALNAAFQLDGSQHGLERARRAPAEFATGPHAMKWDLGTRPITEIAAGFAKGQTVPDSKGWGTEPRRDSNFVRVTVRAPAPLIFLRALPTGLGGIVSVSASSTAEKTGRGARLIQ